MDVLRLCAFACCCLIPACGGAQEEVSYLTFTVPGALGTYPMSINNSMTVTGYYVAAPEEAVGFVRQADGTLITVDVPNSLWTEPESINDDGDITGFYELVSGIPRGFLRYADGRLVTSDPAVIFSYNGPQAQPISINAFKEIAGNYPFPLAASDGFTRSADGTYKTFGFGQGADYPTVVRGLNASGTVVGYVGNGGGGDGSFLLHPDGFSLQFQIAMPGADAQSFNLRTVAEGVNAEGVIAGWYENCMKFCTSRSTGGFVRSVEGVFTLFNPPGTLVTDPMEGFAIDRGSLTVPHWISINNGGSIAGSYTDAQEAQHGFVRNPYGTITSFDPPPWSADDRHGYQRCGGGHWNLLLRMVPEDAGGVSARAVAGLLARRLCEGYGMRGCGRWVAED